MKSESRKWYKAKHESDDILSSIVNLSYVLGIDVEISYTRKILNAHPCYPNLLAVSDVLRELAIDNETLEGTIDDLSGNDYPGLALMKSHSLIVLKRIDFAARCLHCIDSSAGHQILSFETFKNRWSGILIRTSPAKASSIPDSKTGRCRIMPEKFRHFPLLAAISFFLLGIFFTIPALKSLGYPRTFFFLGMNKLTGLLFSLFFFRGAAKSSLFFQKICSLRGVFDCKKVIQSPAGKLFGISLIEWGIIYFYSGIFCFF